MQVSGLGTFQALQSLCDTGGKLELVKVDICAEPHTIDWTRSKQWWVTGQEGLAVVNVTISKILAGVVPGDLDGPFCCHNGCCHGCCHDLLHAMLRIFCQFT